MTHIYRRQGYQWVQSSRPNSAYMRQQSHRFTLWLVACPVKPLCEPILIIFNWTLRNTLRWNLFHCALVTLSWFLRRTAMNRHSWQKSPRTFWFVVVRSGSAKFHCSSQGVRGGTTNVLKCSKLSWRHGQSQRSLHMRIVRGFGFVLIRFISFSFVAIRLTSHCFVVAIFAFHYSSAFSSAVRKAFFTPIEIH